MSSYDFMKREIAKIPLIDTHTHIRAQYPSARGLHDILLYHMVVSDLYSAGCPNGARLSDYPDEKEITERIEEAIPYIPYIRNTSCYYLVRLILRDLYDWDEEITLGNWKTIHEKIKDCGASKQRALEVMQKANIRYSNTEWARRDKGQLSDLFVYNMEWAFFTRAQWGVYDTALFELEYAWNCEAPTDPLPVTCDRNKYNFKKRIATRADCDEAVGYYLSKIPYDKLAVVTGHLSTDITYRPVSDGEMDEALAKRAAAGEKERDIYANYIFEKFLIGSEKHSEMPLGFSVGAEPLPFETGSKMRPETVFELASVFERHPKLRFNIYLSNMAENQAFCTLCRELPNVYLTGYWWHNFFPSFIERVLKERLDMVSVSRTIGFFTDAYCMEWSYAKATLVKDITAKVLAERIDEDRYDRETAVFIAKELLYNTAARFGGFKTI